MRTKEAIDRETKEDQERTWIFMLHHQAPPLSRRAMPSPHPALENAAGGFIPLAPISSSTPSPLVAARAAAASMALHVNANVASTGTWALQSQPSPLSSHAHLPSPRPHEAASVFGGMVKLEKKRPSSAVGSQANKKPLPLATANAHPAVSYAFRSIVSKPSVPEAPTPSAHVQRTPSVGVNGLMDLLPKRPRDEEYGDEMHLRHATERDDYTDEGEMSTPKGGKRPCLPKKCDFPMCKNSSRSRGFCYSHGGGRRCRVDGCANGAVSRDLCKRHGGGRRCRIAGCKSSSESGGLCYSHGGGRRCNLDWCNARAKKGGYCAAHVDNRNALPPVDVVESERGDVDQQTSAESIKISALNSVNPQVIETLLSLSKSPSHSEAEDNSSDCCPTEELLSPRLTNPYAIASILN